MKSAAPFGDNIFSPEEYELYVASWHQALLAEKHIEIIHRQTFLGKRTGQPFEIDLSYRFTQAGLDFWVIIECKHYHRKVDVGPVLELVAKLDDLGAHKGVLVTTKGFQEGAARVASAHGVALVVVDDMGRFDFIASYTGDVGVLGLVGIIPAIPYGTLVECIRFKFEKGTLTLQSPDKLFARLWASCVDNRLDTSSVEDLEKAIYQLERIYEISRGTLDLLQLANVKYHQAVNHASLQQWSNAKIRLSEAISGAEVCSKEGGGKAALSLFAHASILRAQANDHLHFRSEAINDVDVAIETFEYLLSCSLVDSPITENANAIRRRILGNDA